MEVVIYAADAEDVSTVLTASAVTVAQTDQIPALFNIIIIVIVILITTGE